MSRAESSRENRVIRGDNLPIMVGMAAEFTAAFALAYLDPPYNTGARKAEAYDDKMSRSAWRQFMAERLEALWPLMRPDGVVAIQIDDRELGALLGILDEQGRRVLNHVVVKMSELSGVKMSHADRRLPKLKEHLLLVAVGSGSRLRNIRVPKPDAKLARYVGYYNHIVVNPDERVEAWRIEPARAAAKASGDWDGSEAGLVRWKLERAERVVYRTNNAFVARDGGTGLRRLTSPAGVDCIAWDDKQLLVLADHLTEPLGDLWTDLSTINLHREGGVRFRHSKKPEKLLARVMELASEPGDWVIDPFAGAGTTAAIALKTGRRFVTIELGEHAESVVCARLDAVCDGSDTSGIGAAPTGLSYRYTTAMDT